MKKKFINRRKKKFINLNKFFLIFIVFIILFYFLLNFSNISSVSYKLIQKYSNKYNYNILDIEVLNLYYLDQKEILKYFNQYKNKSIFLIPLNKILKKIQMNKWVKNVEIKSDYKNKIKIFIEEEIPLGIFINNNQKILFSKNLTILEILDKNNGYEELINFYGENAIINSKELISSVGKEFTYLIDSAIFIEKRRWNIKLKNSILIKLPEKNIEKAVKNYKKIYTNFSNEELNDIESIDLRIINQAIVKYKNLNND